MLPLPEHNTGLGFHYFPDEAHYRAKDLLLWLPELKALGASWVTLMGSPARAIPESFLRPILEAGIEPIIHLAMRPIQAIDLDALEVLYRCYAQWGIHYVALYDQPNARAMWAPEAWGHEGLVEHFLDLAAPAWQMAQANGLTPVFPPLKQAGDYWDTSFLDAALHLLKQRGQKELLKAMVFGVYGFTGNRPPDWGAGGPARWPESRPYNVPPGSQDQRGFRAFEWYADVIQARLGQLRPMIMLAGGALIGDTVGDLNSSAVGGVSDTDRHTSCNLTIAKAMIERTLPDYLLNVSFWLLAADEAHAASAWRQKDGTALPVLDALRREVATARQGVRSVETRAHFGQMKFVPHSPNGKPIYHYLLLPNAEWNEWMAMLAPDGVKRGLEYIRKFQPTCGFSVEEAKHAAHVTLLGDEQAVSAETEHILRAAGCSVERLCGAGAAEWQSQLNALAEAGTRFAH